MAHQLFGERYLGRKPAWHDLGTVMTEFITASEAVKLARLDYQVIGTPIQAVTLNGAIDFPDKVALVRLPTDDDPEHRCFGIVSEHYKILQNQEVFSALDPISTIWPVETAGALGFGERAFMTFDAGLHEVTGRNGKKDLIAKYFVVIEDKTGGGALRILYTPVRIVCANTLTLGLAQALIKADIRHSAGVELEYKARMKLMAEMQGVEQKALELFDDMAKHEIDKEEFEEILDVVYIPPRRPKKLDLMDVLEMEETDEEDELKSHLLTIQDQYDARNELIIKKRDAVVAHYERFNDEFPDFAQTSWAAYQAITDVEDHVVFRGENVSAYSAVFGPRSKTKAKAFTAIVKQMK